MRPDATDERRGVGRLVERLLTDPTFRAAFRRDPAGACQASGLAGLASELGQSEGALDTLELRESKSSLAGALMAVAAEGLGVAQLAHLAGHGLHDAVATGSEPKRVAHLESTPTHLEPSSAPSGHSAADTVASSPVTGLAPQGPATPGVAELLTSPNLQLPGSARAMLAAGNLDPRVVSVLDTAAVQHRIVVGDVQSITGPVQGQTIDIVSVDGEPVSAGNVGARDLVAEIAALDPSIRPNVIGAPWPIQAEGFVSAADQQNQLRLAFVSASDSPGSGAAGQAAGLSSAVAPETAGSARSTAVFTAVGHSGRSFQRETVEFRALPAPDAAEPATQAAQDLLPDVSGGAITVRSSLLTSGQEQFAARLSALTGLDPRVISAWELAEESGSAARGRQSQGNFDWLNIGYFDSGTGQIASDSAFGNPITAAEQTAKFLKGTWAGASASIRAILGAAGQSSQQQIAAIADSDWASSHYGGGANLRATYDELSDIEIESQ